MNVMFGVENSKTHLNFNVENDERMLSIDTVKTYKS